MHACCFSGHSALVYPSICLVCAIEAQDAICVATLVFPGIIFKTSAVISQLHWNAPYTSCIEKPIDRTIC